MANDRISVVGTNIAEKATMIWNVADMLRGPFKPHEYGLVILPMTVVKRFHDCLLPSWQAVQDTYDKVKHLAVIDGFLTKASGYQFYNTSKFTFDKLLADPENIEANFRDYLAGFSPNVQGCALPARSYESQSAHWWPTFNQRLPSTNVMYFFIESQLLRITSVSPNCVQITYGTIIPASDQPKPIDSLPYCAIGATPVNAPLSCCVWQTSAIHFLKKPRTSAW